MSMFAVDTQRFAQPPALAAESSGHVTSYWNGQRPLHGDDVFSIWQKIVRDRASAKHVYAIPGQVRRPQESQLVRRGKSMPSPLQRVLECDIASISEAGASAIRWLNRKTSRHQELFLKGLARHLSEQVASCDFLLPNSLAATEILSRFHPELAVDLAFEMVSKRPVSELHLFAVSLCREMVATSDSHRSRLAASVEKAIQWLLENPGSKANDWHGRIMVEGFRTISDLEPLRLRGAICRYLPEIGEMELTAVLDEVAKASGAARCGVSSELDRALGELWSRYLNSTTALNSPGVLARVLEIRLNSGMSASEVVSKALTCNDAASVLFLLATRHHRQIPKEERIAIFCATAKQLNERNQRSSLTQLVKSVLRDGQLQIADLAQILAAAK